MKRFIAGCAAVSAITVFLFSSSSQAEGKTEILWDRFGVAHIFATTRDDMFHAHGWAQMETQANLLLHLYGESRGRAAEYWGGDANVEPRSVGAVERHARARQRPGTTRRIRCSATTWTQFARGINDFAKAHPESISAENRVVLPVSGVDVVGHALRVVHYGYMASEERMQREVESVAARRRAAAGRISRPRS